MKLVMNLKENFFYNSAVSKLKSIAIVVQIIKLNINIWEGIQWKKITYARIAKDF